MAAARLVAMIQDKTVPAALQFAAVRDLLDRAGVSGKQEVEIEVKVALWEQVALDILVDVEEDDDNFSDNVIDAEIVEESLSLAAAKSEEQRDREMEERAATRARNKRRGIKEPVESTIPRCDLEDDRRQALREQNLIQRQADRSERSSRQSTAQTKRY